MSEKPRYEVIGVLNLRPPYKPEVFSEETEVSHDVDPKGLDSSIKKREEPQFAFLREVDGKMDELGSEWKAELARLEREGKLTTWYIQAYRVALMGEVSKKSLEKLVGSVVAGLVSQMVSGSSGTRLTVDLDQEDWLLYQKLSQTKEELRRVLTEVIKKPNLVWQVSYVLGDWVKSVNVYAKTFPGVEERVVEKLKREGKEIDQREETLLRAFESLLVVMRLRNLVFLKRRSLINRVKRWSKESSPGVLEHVLKDILRLTGLAHALGVIVSELLSPVVDYVNELDSVDNQDFLDEGLVEVFEALASIRKGVSGYQGRRKSRPGSRIKFIKIDGSSSVLPNYFAEVFTALVQRDVDAARLAVARRIETYPGSYPESGRISQAFAAEIGTLSSQDRFSEKVRLWSARNERRKRVGSKEEARFFEYLLGQTIIFTTPKHGLVSGRILEVSQRYPSIGIVLTKGKQGTPTLLSIRALVKKGKSREQIMEEFGVEKVWFVKVEMHDNAGSRIATQWYYPGDLRRNMERLSGEVEDLGG